MLTGGLFPSGLFSHAAADYEPFDFWIWDNRILHSLTNCVASIPPALRATSLYTREALLPSNTGDTVENRSSMPRAIINRPPHRTCNLPPCHCEPVTDVTGAAIRSPCSAVSIFPCNCGAPPHQRPLCVKGAVSFADWGIAPQRFVFACGFRL